MVSGNNTPVDLEITAGLPYNRRIRVSGGSLLWPTEDSFEVRSQIRAGKTPATPLVADLTPFLKSKIENGDILVDLELTGANTRALGKGYYDIVISDKGDMDAKALPILSGKVKISALVTGAGDE